MNSPKGSQTSSLATTCHRNIFSLWWNFQCTLFTQTIFLVIILSWFQPVQWHVSHSKNQERSCYLKSWEEWHFMWLMNRLTLNNKNDYFVCTFNLFTNCYKHLLEFIAFISTISEQNSSYSVPCGQYSWRSCALARLAAWCTLGCLILPTSVQARLLGPNWSTVS